MSLLRAQLLFVTRHADDVQLDLVVLSRPDTPSSPDVGTPIAFDFALPGDAVWREALARLLQQWADDLAIVDVDRLRRHARTLVRLATGDASVTLEPAVR